MSQIGVRVEVDPWSVERFNQAGKMVERMPNILAKLVRDGLYRDARRYLLEFRAGLSGKFKVRNTKAGNAFKVFVAGDRLDNLRAGVFTRWKAGKIYESGGTIVGRGALAVPINPRAFTADGRVKKKWRDPRNFPDLFAVKTKRRVLLVQASQEIKTAGVAKRYGMMVGSFRSWTPMFVLVKSTRRSPVLRFYQDFAAMFGRGGKGVEAAVSHALRFDPEAGMGGRGPG